MEQEYRRWLQKIGDRDIFHSDETVGTNLVLAAHFLLVDTFFHSKEGIGGVGPRSVELLESAVGRQHTSYGGQAKWTDMWQRCATLMYGLIKNHPFHDTNKRTALLVALAFLQHHKYVIKLEQKRLDRFVVAIAENRLQKFFDGFPKSERKLVPPFKGADSDTQVYQIADFLYRNTRRINHVTPLVTFNSLNKALKNHGFELIEPKGNYIDIARWVPEKRSFFGKITPRHTVKLGQVGFPSWKSTVSRNAMKTVREVTGLTTKNGCDSDVLFMGEEPLNALISEYMEPLKRLAYK